MGSYFSFNAPIEPARDGDAVESVESDRSERKRSHDNAELSEEDALLHTPKK